MEPLGRLCTPPLLGLSYPLTCYIFETGLKDQYHHPFYSAKKAFWSTPEFLAQANEISDILSKSKWEIKAFGSGIVPFMVDGKNVNDLRAKAKRDKIEPCQPISYKELLNATGKSTP